MTVLPWTYEARPDTQTTNVRLGIWLFLASETMLFGSVFSAYVLLRTGSPNWPDAGSMLDASRALIITPLLIAATGALRPRGMATDRMRLVASSVAGAAFVLMKVLDYSGKIGAGQLPSTNLLLACWFVLTGLHALHVAAGVIANTWVAAGVGRSDVRDRARMHALRLYWYFVDLVWLVILVGFYLV